MAGERTGSVLPRLGGRSAAVWLALAAALAAWLLALSPLGRAMEWDETVFFSQTGNLPGVDAPPARFAASREHGPVLLIGAARLVAGDLAGIRAIYLAVSLLLVVLAFREVERTSGRWTGVVGAALFSTFWVPTLFFASFFGPLLGAAAALLTTALYLRLRSEPVPAAVRNGLLLGLALAAAFAFRNLETAVVVAVLAAHAAVWRPMDVLRRWRGAVAALASFTAAFVVPWTWYTIAEWGSVRARWISTRTQTNTEGGQGHPFQLHNGADEYLRMLVGVDGFYRPMDPVPTWVVLVLTVGLLGLAAAVVALLLSRLARPRRSAAAAPEPTHAVLFTVLSAASFGVFFFVSQLVRERYLHHGLIFGAVVAAQALVAGWRLLRARFGGGAASRTGIVVAVATATVVGLPWLSAQAWMATSIQERRVQTTSAKVEIGTLLATIAEGRPCRIAGGIRHPTVQAVSGCVMTAFRGRNAPPDGRFDGDLVFVAWDPREPTVPDYVRDWPRLEGVRGIRRMVLSYGVPPR